MEMMSAKNNTQNSAKNATNLIGDLQKKFREREGADPFLLLRECLDVQTLTQHKGITDVNDFRLTGYQNTFSGFGDPIKDGLVKNKDLF